MGLDIYLRKCPDIEAANRAEAAAEKASEKLWAEYGDYDILTDAKKAEARSAVEKSNASFGCPGGQHVSIEALNELDSSIDPAHMFKVGYFRSSYNEGGIERVLRNKSLPTLHDIFGTGGNERTVRPDWSAALALCDEAIAGYSAFLDGPAGKYLVIEIHPMFDRGVADEAAALASIVEKMAGRTDGGDFNSFSCADGDFFLDGAKVLAIMPKTYRPSHESDNFIEKLLNRPSLFIVYERPQDGKPDWYLTALRIVKETIEYVLAQPDKQHFYLVWSG